jgi:hypothetical protein
MSPPARQVASAINVDQPIHVMDAGGAIEPCSSVRGRAGRWKLVHGWLGWYASVPAMDLFRGKVKRLTQFLTSLAGRGGGAPGLGRGPPGRGRGAGSSVFGCVRGPGGAGGGGLGGRWVVCGRAGRRSVRRLPAIVFSRSGLWFFPFWGFCVPIGLVGLYDTRSVRGYSIHTLSLSGGR